MCINIIKLHKPPKHPDHALKCVGVLQQHVHQYGEASCTEGLPHDADPTCTCIATQKNIRCQVVSISRHSMSVVLTPPAEAASQMKHDAVQGKRDTATNANKPGCCRHSTAHQHRTQHIQSRSLCSMEPHSPSQSRPNALYSRPNAL